MTVGQDVNMSGPSKTFSNEAFTNLNYGHGCQMATGGSFHMPRALQRRKRKFRQNNNVLGLSKHVPSKKPLGDFISFW